MDINLIKVLAEHKLWVATGRVEGIRANLRGADLREAYLESADLKGADLKGANLERADLRGADLEGADLKGANLRGADLEGANLRGADLRGADLREAYLERADLEGCDNIVGFTLTRHFGFFVIDSGYLKIGCLGLPINDWLGSYQRIGKEHAYSVNEIEIYQTQIKLLSKIRELNLENES